MAVPGRRGCHEQPEMRILLHCAVSWPAELLEANVLVNTSISLIQLTITCGSRKLDLRARGYSTTGFPIQHTRLARC
jgi:hypothetical protein